VGVKQIFARLRSLRRFSAHALALYVILCFVPNDDVYYHFERLVSHFGPLGSISQHIRSSPSTAISIMMESSQKRFIEVEQVEISLGYAVNPTAQVENVRHYSDVLGEERSYQVYLPPGYEESSESYPVLYLLHGMSQNFRWWAEVARVDRIATSMIDAGKIRPSIIVMPNGNRIANNESTTSLYDNRCRTGLDLIARALTFIGDLAPNLRIYNISCEADFASYIIRDVMSDVDSRFRTNGENYVGGFSLGGRGAVQLALVHDDVFDGAFGLSGNYDYLRNRISRNELENGGHTRLFLGSGDNDQRGVYGDLNTFLFHKDLAGIGVEHAYCIYQGTHGSAGWVSIMPRAFEYLLGSVVDAGVVDGCESSSPVTARALPTQLPVESSKQDSN
jgi:enterochelin esterase-like enzyme